MIDEVIRIAREAGAVLLAHYARAARGGIDVERKADDSPVTAADREANELIVERLARHTPDVPVVAEESDLPTFDVRRHWTRFWLVDPLDGTKEFLKHNGEFTVNIARIEAGEPVLGVLHAPAFDLVYYAVKGEGTWKVEGMESPQPVYSRQAPSDLPLTVLTSRSHAVGMDLDVLLPGREIAKVMAVGSALKFGLLAEGQADVYVRTSPTMEWDVAAGDCLWRNSGRDRPRTSPLTYNKPEIRNEGFVLGLDP